MWHELLIAMALVMVVEGLLPFLNPGAMRKIMKAASEMDDRALRISGLISMILGVIMLYIVN
ncbi:MAG: DUF2065 domain-containing protein [Candidatus Sedimenticola sp. PURPLELP]